MWHLEAEIQVAQLPLSPVIVVLGHSLHMLLISLNTSISFCVEYLSNEDYFSMKVVEHAISGVCFCGLKHEQSVNFH